MSKPVKSKTNRKKAGQMRSSIVIKLNLAMMGLLISAMISVNVLIVLTSFGYIVYQSETTAIRLLEQAEITQNISSVETSFLDYTFVYSEYASGWNLFDEIIDLLPNQAEGRRSFEFRSQPDLAWHQNWANVHYRVYFPHQDGYVLVERSLEQPLQSLFWLFVMLFGFELLLIVSRFSKNHVKIADALKPLTQLTESAKNLQEDMQAMTSFKKTDIETMAGAISKIDAKKLDQKAFVEYDQEELRDLADAINDMLVRINESYQSQVRFVSDASHELRTPVAVIQGYANMLDRWGKSDEKTLQESIDAIKSESDHMKTLIEHLLFLARGDSDTIKLQLENFDVNALLEEVVKEARLIDEGHEYQFQHKEPAWIIADKSLIKQVLRILVDNASKYSPEGETILLKLAKQEHQIDISVQDNGIGIKPKDVPHIFDRFYRSDESRDKKTGGSGLGLAIAKWIVEKHGGQFQVISRVGIGTRVTVSLQIHQ
jgi:two-component system, OmpR family, sensor histidine kinase ArlS